VPLNVTKEYISKLRESSYIPLLNVSVGDNLSKLVKGKFHHLSFNLATYLVEETQFPLENPSLSLISELKLEQRL
jgi:hypothetical protein